jgi:hypothetical protein
MGFLKGVEAAKSTSQCSGLKSPDILQKSFTCSCVNENSIS